MFPLSQLLSGFGELNTDQVNWGKKISPSRCLRGLFIKIGLIEVSLRVGGSFVDRKIIISTEDKAIRESFATSWLPVCFVSAARFAFDLVCMLHRSLVIRQLNLPYLTSTRLDRKAYCKVFIFKLDRNTINASVETL